MGSSERDGKGGRRDEEEGDGTRKGVGERGRELEVEDGEAKHVMAARKVFAALRAVPGTDRSEWGVSMSVHPNFGNHYMEWHTHVNVPGLCQHADRVRSGAAQPQEAWCPKEAV